MALSASVSAQDGTIGVAYAVDTEEDDLAYKMLKYAVRTGSGEWDIVVVDESASVGTYCSLTYNADGDPLIAYYAIQSHTGRRLENLKLARRTDTGWELETVAEAGNVGRDNTLWVDSTGAPHIVTYNDTTNEILHYVYR